MVCDESGTHEKGGGQKFLTVVNFFPVSSGNHKQKFYWGHKEIMIPGKDRGVVSGRCGFR